MYVLHVTFIMFLISVISVFTDIQSDIRCKDTGELSDASVSYALQIDEDNSSLSDSVQILLPGPLSPFQCIVDTLNSVGDDLVHAEYFLYDITGDSLPELWVKCGTCEADRNLWVFTNDSGKPRKILSTDGGHIEFFRKGDLIGSATYNCGEGYVSIYSYDGKRIKVKYAKFSMWNENGEPRALKKKQQFMVSLWENSDSAIEFIFLK